MGPDGFEPPMYLTSRSYSPLASPICIETLKILTDPKRFELLTSVLETDILNQLLLRTYYNDRISLSIEISAIRYI